MYTGICINFLNKDICFKILISLNKTNLSECLSIHNVWLLVNSHIGNKYLQTVSNTKKKTTND